MLASEDIASKFFIEVHPKSTKHYFDIKLYYQPSDSLILLKEHLSSAELFCLCGANALDVAINVWGARAVIDALANSLITGGQANYD